MSAAPGWYPHPKMVDTNRYWDGEKWTEHIAQAIAPGRAEAVLVRPESPIGYIFVGFVVGLIGGAVVAFGAADAGLGIILLGYLTIAAGSILAFIGVIGSGVRLGMSHMDYARQQGAR